MNPVGKEAKTAAGFTLIEVIISIGLFLIITYAVYLAYSNVLDVIVKNQWRAAAVSILENQIETIRNMPYQDVGIEGGYPPGKLKAEKDVSFGGINFILKAFVRNVDDPFDGTLGGTPNDTAPADYRLVELEIICIDCRDFGTISITMTTTVALQGLETTSKNGSLFINVFDADGKSISDVDVLVKNNALTPTITITDTTNLNGILQLVDIPTSTTAYEITVSKQGYSSEKTYPRDAPENPNPVKPHATVAEQQITSISFAIDKVSTLSLRTSDQLCAAVPNIDFQIEGAKLIGSNPDILKYSTTSATNANGIKAINNLEWDTYNIDNTNSSYDLSGENLSSPIVINPNATADFNWLMEPKSPSALLVTVLNSNGQSINDASANLSKTGFNKTLFTGRRASTQTDWSNSQYSSQSGNIETQNPAGEIKLLEFQGKYPTSTEWLISKSFDFGTSTALSFYNLSWNPTSQPPSTDIYFQLASNNDDATWNFVGPDGGINTFYASSSAAIGSLHNNHRYLRYKVFMKTDDENYTPAIDNVNVEFSSACVPSGQVFFNGLGSGDYALTVQKDGYQAYTDSNLSISSNWQDYTAQLLSQ